VGELGERPAPGAAEVGIGNTGDRQPDGFRSAGVPQVQGEGGGGSPVVRIGGQAPLDDRDQFRRGLGGELAQIGEPARGSDGQRVGRRRRVPGGDAGQGVERRGGHPEDVGRRPRRPAAGDGRIDVGRGDLAGRDLAEDAGHAQVGEHRPPLGREHDVGRGKVAVDDAVHVRVSQRGRDRSDGGDHLPRAQAPAAGQQRRQAAALEQFEHQCHPGIAPAAGLVHHLDQPHQMRMVELAQQHRLPGLALRVAVHQNLDRHGRAAPPGHRPPHLPRAAPAQQRLEDVARHQRRLGGTSGLGGGHG
jgi:hypothetical protein